MILLTGASGCTGSYLLEALLAVDGPPVIAWVRDPARLRGIRHPRLQIWSGGLEAIGQVRSRLAGVSTLIHVATAWGGPGTFEINARRSWDLLQALDPAVCREAHFFSTASLLGPDLAPWPQALRIGTDYIRSKAALHQRLMAQAPQIPTSIYYPTVVLGGDAMHPATAVAAALPDLGRWLRLARWLRADGRFHLIHARDIARIVVHRITHRLPPARLVLGNPAVRVDELIETLTRVYGFTPPPLRLPLDPALGPLTAALHPWMSDWDRFSLQQRHTVYPTSINAATYGLPTDLMPLEAMVRASL